MQTALLSGLYAYDGLMAGQKNLKIITTEYFDIIFPESSRKTAEALAQRADSIYEELSATYKLNYKLHIPVVITPATDTFNAYASIVPFNHIVLFDSKPDENMAVHSESLLSTFTHELTHTITMNDCNEFWQGLKKVLGSTYYVGAATSTMAVLEGATVSQESMKGEGRLNDEYSRQIVKQAKIEGNIPKYASIQGARDIYPYGNVSYLFGGEFASYLRKKYGEDKYAQYWYHLTNWKAFTYDLVFKQVYGITERQAWKEFFEQYSLPPLTDGTKYATQIVKKSSLYENLTSCDTGFAYCDLHNGGIYFSSGIDSRPKFLFAQNGIRSLKLSQDGKFLVVNYTDNSKYHSRNKTYLYDLKTRQKFVIKKEHVRDAAVFSIGNDYYVSQIISSNQEEKIEISKIEFNKYGRIKKLSFQTEIATQNGKQFFSIVGNASGKFHYILKDNLTFSINSARFNPEDGSISIKKIPLPYSDMRIRHLGIAGEKLIFSYTRKDTLPRFCLADENGNFEMYTKDVSGGYYFPCLLESEKLAYIGTFSEYNRLFYCDKNALPLESAKTAPQEILSETLQEKQENTQKENAAQGSTALGKTFPEKKYTVPPASFHGSIFPISISQLYQLSNDFSVKNFIAPWGITYATTTPWSSPVFLLSCGYSIFSNAGSFSASISGGSETDVFKYSLLAQTGFDANGFKQTYSEGSVSSTIPLLESWNLLLSLKSYLFYGQQYLMEKWNNPFVDFLTGSATNVDSKTRFYTQTDANLGFSNVRRWGKSPLEKYGVQFNFIYSVLYYEQTNNLFAQNLSFFLGGCIPHLIPIECKNGFLYNLPLTLNARLFPSLKYFASLSGELTLFAYEIQQSPNWFTILYFNRVYLTAGYAIKFATNTYHGSWFFQNIDSYWNEISTNQIYYTDDLFVSLNLNATPNFGAAATTSLQFNLQAKFHYIPNPLPGGNKFSLDIAGIMVF